MYNDTYFTNTYVAQVGGVSLDNINQLERYFITMVDWDLNISTEEFDFYEQNMVAAYNQYMQQQLSLQLNAALSQQTMLAD